MRPEIEENTGTGDRAFTPRALLQLGAEAIVVGLEAHYAAEIAAADNLLHRLEITVVTAILVDGEQAAAFLCESHQFDRLFERWSEWFVDDDVATGLQTLPGERIVCFVRRSDNNETEVLHAQQLFEAADDAHVGIELRRFVDATLQNRGEPQSGNRTDYRRVECAPSQTESN